MRNFPQELVDKVIDELFALVGRDNSYQGNSKRSHIGFGVVWGISHYSLVSKVWAGPAQKHHFSTVYLDRSAILKKWLTRIPPDPTGVSRHVRKLVLRGFDPVDLEDAEEHLRAFTRVECLSVNFCNGILHHPSILEWFSTIGSSLTELRIIESRVAPRTITSLLAALPLLQILQILNFQNLDDTDDVNPLAPPRIPFFEGTNRFVLQSDNDRSYPADSLDWIPTLARFGQLEIDVACFLGHPDLVNRWFASSCTTLTNLAIRGDPYSTPPPKQPNVYRSIPLTKISSSSHPRGASAIEPFAMQRTRIVANLNNPLRWNFSPPHNINASRKGYLGLGWQDRPACYEVGR